MISVSSLVMHCISRTRDILGGTSLAAAGVPDAVYMLWNGTHGWLMEGLVLGPTVPRCAAAQRPRARERASNLARRTGIWSIERATLARWRDDTMRTTYVLDGALVMRPEHWHPERPLRARRRRHGASDHCRALAVADGALHALCRRRCQPRLGADRNGARTPAGPVARQRPERAYDAAGARCAGAPCQPSDHRYRQRGCLHAFPCAGGPLVPVLGPGQDARVHGRLRLAPWAHRCGRCHGPPGCASNLAALGCEDMLVLEDGNVAWCRQDSRQPAADASALAA